MPNEGTPSPSSFNPFKLRKTELARLLDVSDETIANYTKAGMPVSGKGHSARYVLSQCVQYVIQFEAGKLAKQKRPISDDIDELNRRKELAITLQQEYKTAELMDEMVHVGDVEKELAGRWTAVRAKLLAVPGSWAPQLVGLKTIPDAVEALSDLVFQTLNDIVNAKEDDDDDLEAVEAEEIVEVDEEVESNTDDTESIS